MTTLTSIAAFHQTTSDRERQAQLLMTLYRAKGPLTDREACSILDWEHPSVVSARRNDLIKLGKVGELGEKKNPVSGKLNIMWGEIKSTLF